MTIQQLKRMKSKQHNDETIKKMFVKEMSKGNIKAALRLLTKFNRGSILHLSDIVSSTSNEELTVLDVLKSKRPASTPPSQESIIPAAHDPPTIHPVIFDSKTAKTIRSAALRITGAAGPSGIDARGWRRLCTSFKSAADDLCHSLALLT